MTATWGEPSPRAAYCHFLQNFKVSLTRKTGATRGRGSDRPDKQSEGKGISLGRLENYLGAVKVEAVGVQPFFKNTTSKK